MNKSDFYTMNHGSLYMIHPTSQTAKEWATDNVSDSIWFGSGFAVEPRYADSVIAGMEDAGLVRA